MSINKYTLGTIVGAALLGLAKSKFGGRNEGKPLIIPLDGYTNDTTIFLTEKDKILNPELMGITELPVLGRLSFTVIGSTDRPSENIDDQIIDYGEQLKTCYFEENDALDDDNPEKKDWESSEDVPDYYIDLHLDEKRQELLEEHYEEISTLIHQFASGVQYQIIEKLSEDSDDHFGLLQKIKRNRPIYVYVELYDYQADEGNSMTLSSTFKIYINSENSLLTLAFIHGFEEMLDNLEDFDDFDGISITEVEDKWISTTSSNLPKLRKR